MVRNAKLGGMTFNRAGLGGSHDVSKAAELLFRAGYAAHGTIYLVIGAFALVLAIGFGGKITDPKGVLSTIGQQPFGKFILLVLGIGLIGYVLWRFAQAFLNIERKPNDMKHNAARVGQAVSGIIYSTLAVIAIRGFLANGETSTSQESPFSRLMASDGGQYWMMLLGGILIAVAAAQVFRGLKQTFMEEFEGARLNADEEKAVRISGKIGFVARGVTFAIIGYFCFKAGIQYDASEAKTSKGALEFVAAQPYGYVLLGLIAVGFIAFAVHCLMAAKNRRFRRL